MDSGTPSTNPKADLAAKLKSANNILVTVSRNPSVDQLSALLGLTLLLNKMGKHAAAVFSGEVPSTIEFLQPEETIEKNTDSLRDFIIALDKSKADKLRYKVEDDVVRIFITPYKTSISQEDLEFSQGDFNVDLVVAIGVQQQEDLDEAITAHGRILHDATVSSINTSPEGGLGSINWHDTGASSLSELVTELTGSMGDNLLNNQIATALLTGIVAETARFSNEKTSSQTMSISAKLMAAGANQQLVATKLEEPAPAPEPVAEVAFNPDDNDQPDDNSAGEGAMPDAEPPKPQDGTLEINHTEEPSPEVDKADPDAAEAATSDQFPAMTVDQTGELPAFELPAPNMDSPEAIMSPDSPENTEVPAGDHLSEGGKLMTEPPALGGQLTANSVPEALDPATDPLSAVNVQEHELLDHNSSPSAPVLAEATPAPIPAPVFEPEPTPAAPAPEPIPEPAPKPAAPTPLITGMTPPPPAWVPPSDDPFNLGDIQTTEPEHHTLAELETSLGSPHATGVNPTDTMPSGLDDARDEVNRALNDGSTAPGAQPPIEALNAQPFGDQLHPADPTLPLPSVDQPSQDLPAILQNDIPTMPSPPENPMVDLPSTAPQVVDPTAPPPVPPPMPFQFGGPGGTPQP